MTKMTPPTRSVLVLEGRRRPSGLFFFFGDGVCSVSNEWCESVCSRGLGGVRRDETAGREPLGNKARSVREDLSVPDRLSVEGMRSRRQPAPPKFLGNDGDDY